MFSNHYRRIFEVLHAVLAEGDIGSAGQEIIEFVEEAKTQFGSEPKVVRSITEASTSSSDSVYSIPTRRHLGAIYGSLQFATKRCSRATKSLPRRDGQDVSAIRCWTGTILLGGSWSGAEENSL